MKRVLTFQILVLAIGCGLLWLAGMQQKISSFAIGGLIVTGNFILLGLGWGVVFRKKLIALPVLIIVFKYAILGVIIYHFVKQSWMQPFWFAAGIATMMIGSLMYGLTLGFFKDPDDGSSNKEE
ncbi:hypothetical protein [Bdellovibrio sp. HCB337]|uniref:hypothetical protein n=1 Tax=Bdellovibrio sp. HCB337 TaxID=3394358 RepID=UPI0039A535C0